MVGKPVYHGQLNSHLGSWMEDPFPFDPKFSDKVWVTLENDTKTLYEYANETAFREGILRRKIELGKKFKVRLRNVMDP